MTKVSAIIPTMQKNIKILDLLVELLVAEDLIGEIIVVDNSGKGYTYNSRRICFFNE